jgi:hypothetical protein
MVRLSSLAAAAALLVAPAMAPASTRVVSSYAYYTPVKGDPDYQGRVQVVFRTSRALPLNDAGFPTTKINVGFGAYRVSPDLNCYEADEDVRKGSSAAGLPGTRLPVRIGRNGSLLRRTLTVLPHRAGYDRGGLIGCTKDPKAGYLIFQTEPQPEVEPVRIFFQADAGPYIDKLTWVGWGTHRAVGRGVYVNECPIGPCAPTKFRKKTTVVFDHSAACPAWGARTYSGHTTVYDAPDKPRRVRVSGAGFC